MLAFGAVLLAGLLFAGGALAIFLSAPAVPTPSPILGGDASPVSSLPIFIQPTPTPSPTPAPTPFPSGSLLATPLATPSGLIESPPPSVIILPTPTPSVLPTPTRTPRPPTPTPQPTPQPTPINCAPATGTPTKYATLDSQNMSRTVPEARGWCLDGVRITPGQNYGHVKLMLGNRVLFEANCEPGSCVTYEQVWAPDEILIKPGKILTDMFICDGDLVTPDLQPCTELTPTGATIEIGYETVPAP